MTPAPKRIPAAETPHWIVPAAWSGVLLLLCYAPVLWKLVRQWETDDDMGHGFFVPLVAGYIAWQKRGQLAAVPPASSCWGLALLIWGAVQLYIATIAAELFLARTAFLISLIGAVLFLFGRRHAAILAFPLLLMFFMVPIPAVVYGRITFPLQLLASRAADFTLTVLQVPVLRRGNILELPNQTLSVVEACSGIRSLLSLSFLSLVYGYFFEDRRWVRIALFAATVPIAMVANAGRVTLTGLLSQYRPELADGFFHSASGWVIFMVALAFLIAFHYALTGIWRLAHGRG